jgi:hypothetical protein
MGHGSRGTRCRGAAAVITAAIATPDGQLDLGTQRNAVVAKSS